MKKENVEWLKDREEKFPPVLILRNNPLVTCKYYFLCRRIFLSLLESLRIDDLLLDDVVGFAYSLLRVLIREFTGVLQQEVRLVLDVFSRYHGHSWRSF